MKAIIPVILAAILLFTFAACGGNKAEEDITNDMTSVENDISDAVEDGKNDMNNIGNELTENGNVTDQTGEGILNEAITDISEMLEGDDGKATTNEETTKNR